MQGVKNLTAEVQLAAEGWVRSLALHSGLKDSFLGPGTSLCHRDGH